MKILFSWTGVTSYMADCWRALQEEPGVSLKVIVETAASGKEFAAAETLKGLDCELVDRTRAADAPIAALTSSFSPDIVFVGGWRSVTTRRVMARYAQVPQVFCLDMPWRWSLRCIAARFALRSFVRRFEGVYVPGASSAFYARWLGFPKERIFRRLYAVDQRRLRAVPQAPGRTGFLFVGRFSPEKGVPLIERAYARYRALGGTWTIDYYGQGGKFVQADGMPQVYAGHACLVLASSFDPWPLVMLESRAAGLEVIASDRCGNGTELGAHRVPYGDVEAMARQMLAVERGARIPPPDDLDRYDCQAWAPRTLALAREIVVTAPREVNGMQVVDGLLRAHGKIKPDEVWVHGLWTPDKWCACLKAVLTGRRLVRMTHGGLSPVYLTRQGRWKKRLVKPIERFCFALADRVVTTCAAEETWARAWGYGGPLERLDLRGFFTFDLEAVAARRQALRARRTGEPVRVLALGRRHPLKGTDALREAAKGLPVELREVSDHFGEELERDWAWAELLVLPSLSENFGLVVAEALSRGIPAIVTDGASAWEGQEGVVYVRGYRDADFATRVKLLREALRAGV